MWIENRTCAHQTWSDFNGSADPKDQDKAKNAIYGSCSESDARAGKKCWSCSESEVVHSVFTNGNEEGFDYTPTSCGSLKEGTCRWVNPDGSLGEDPKEHPMSYAAPDCYQPVSTGLNCTAAQVQHVQTP